MMFSPESMEDLQKSRQVCQSWNMMMAQRTRMEKHTIRRKAELRADRIRMMWEYFGHHTYLPDIATASSLAHNKILGSVTDLFLYNLDLASVHSEHLASLAACVTRGVWNHTWHFGRFRGRVYLGWNYNTFISHRDRVGTEGVHEITLETG